MAAGRKAKRRWAQAQTHDPWVRRARSRGLPSRAAFKLEEMAAHHGLFKPGLSVLELGSAPGGWTQLAAAGVGPRGRVVAVDRLDMALPAGVRFIRGDLASAQTRSEVLMALSGKADLVICDLAPNLTGIRDVDEANQAELSSLAVEMAELALNDGGNFLIKAFMGLGSTALESRLAGKYRKVRSLKPAASRAGSKEFYFLAQGYQLWG